MDVLSVWIEVAMCLSSIDGAESLKSGEGNEGICTLEHVREFSKQDIATGQEAAVLDGRDLG